MIYGVLLPGIAFSMLVGNALYAREALRLAKRTGREDVCAIPYGINTPTMVAYVALGMPANAYVLLPAAGLMGTLFALARMSESSEITVMRSSGLSMVQAAAVPERGS